MENKELRNHLHSMVTVMQNQVATSLVELQRNSILTENVELNRVADYVKSSIGTVGFNAMNIILGANAKHNEKVQVHPKSNSKTSKISRRKK